MAVLRLPSLSQTLGAAAIVYAGYAVYYYFTTGASRRRLIAAHGCKPTPSLTKYDILGIFTIRRQLQAHSEHRLLLNIHEKFESTGSNTWCLRLLFKNLTMTREPENLKTVQAVDFQKWGLGEARKMEFHYFLGTGIFTTDSHEWQHSRDMLRPNFVRSQVGDIDMFERHVGHLIHAIPRDGSTVDLQQLFFKLTIDSATEFLFGVSTGCLDPVSSMGNEIAERFAEAFTRAQERMEKEEWLGRLSWLIRSQQYKDDCKYVHDFVDALVEKAMARQETAKRNSARYVFLDELISQTTDKVRIRSETLNVLLAGRDTTASLLSNVFHTLARRPDVEQALRNEISTQLGDKAPTFAQIKEMKYLRAVLNESLRIYPIVPTNSREALVDTVLPLGGGKDGKSPMFMPKGGIMAWNTYSMHRRKDLYGEDADDFRPERWLGEKGLRPTWEFLPFNGGARICLGQQYALTEASYTVIRLLQEFKGLENRDPEPWRESLTLTCTCFGGCKVALTPA